MNTFLKFRYFLVVLFCFSCGEKQKTPKAPNVAPEKQVITEKKADRENKVILFFGNSLTAGYGLDTEESFPALIQKRIDSLKLPYTAINSGLSGETTTSGLNRLQWVLNQKVDIFVLELGANDGLRGIPLKETRKNLQTIIDQVLEKNPETRLVLAGMQIPPNMGQEYTKEFKSIFPDLAKKNGLPLIPFLLDGVAGNPDLNLPDGIHPTAEGQLIVKENVWSVIKTLLE